MQPVSQAWKDNQRETITAESFVEISLRVGDPDAKENAVLSDSGHEAFSSPQDILDGLSAPVKYAALEPGVWVLDGTFQLLGEEEEAEYEGFLPAGEAHPLLTFDGREFYSAR